CRIRQHLSLNIEAPLLHVRILVLWIPNAQGHRCERHRRRTRAGIIQPCIRDRKAREGRRRISSEVLLERSNKRGVKEYAVAGAHGRLSGTEGVPCQPESWGEIAIVVFCDLVTEW